MRDAKATQVRQHDFAHAPETQLRRELETVRTAEVATAGTGYLSPIEKQPQRGARSMALGGRCYIRRLEMGGPHDPTPAKRGSHVRRSPELVVGIDKPHLNLCVRRGPARSHATSVDP